MTKTEWFRKKLRNMFSTIWDCKIDHPMFEDTVGELMEGVIAAYDNEQRPAEWIPYFPETGDMWRCSNCKSITRLPYNTELCPYDYCPGCGAMMLNGWSNSPYSQPSYISKSDKE